MSLKVLIVEDHETARLGISQLLRAYGFSIAGAVGSGAEAASMVASTDIDVVLLDVRIPDKDGLSAIESIRAACDGIPIVILTAYENPTYVARAAALGANDYILKNGSSEEMRGALIRAAHGEPPLPDSRLESVRRMMREEIDTMSLPVGFPLTGRETQVLRHIALGLSNKEIARSLTISVETVKEHVQNVLRKIGANDRTDAAVRAIKSGLVD